jgi:hypothetical protein
MALARLMVGSLLALCLAGCHATPVTTGGVRDVEGVAHDPLHPAAAEASVLIFVMPDCPIANAYAPEIQRIMAEHADDPLHFYLVHVDADMTAERARAHAEDFGYACTILLDTEHDLVTATGATTTPEAVVVAGGGEILYQGRIDDWYGALGRKRIAARRRELRDCLAALVAGEDVAPSRTEAVGCIIPDLPR